MNKILGTLTAVALFGFTSLASAEEISGKVAGMDAASGVIQLEDGSIYTVGDGVSLEGLEPGTEVTVSYEEKDGQNVATQITPAQ